MSEEAEEASSPPVPAANEETPNDEESSPNDASAEQHTTVKAEEEVAAKEEEEGPTPNEEEAKPADPPSSSGEQLQQNKNGEDVPLTFPQRLMNILMDEVNIPVVEWLPHGKGFLIKDKKLFENELLAKYFKASKFTSFTRKLNRWNFVRVTRGPEAGAYYHPQFRKGDMRACMQMTCIHSKSAQSIQPMNPIALGLGENQFQQQMMMAMESSDPNAMARLQEQRQRMFQQQHFQQQQAFMAMAAMNQQRMGGGGNPMPGMPPMGMPGMPPMGFPGMNHPGNMQQQQAMNPNNNTSGNNNNANEQGEPQGGPSHPQQQQDMNPMMNFPQHPYSNSFHPIAPMPALGMNMSGGLNPSQRPDQVTGFQGGAPQSEDLKEEDNALVPQAQV